MTPKCTTCGSTATIDNGAACAQCGCDREAIERLDAAPCSAAVPLGKRGPIEIHTGAVLLTVHAQQEPDGTWAAMVPDLTDKCQSAATRDDAIKLACQAVSVSAPNKQITH
jgi:hypothetical protein